MRKPFVGTIRRPLLVRGSHRWNGWVRGTTAWMELRGLLRSER